MNTSLNRNRNLALNSLIYPSTTSMANSSVNAGGSSMKSWFTPFWISMILLGSILVVLGILGSVYHTTVASWFNSASTSMPVAPVGDADAPAPGGGAATVSPGGGAATVSPGGGAATASPGGGAATASPGESSMIMEKVLPSSGNSQVFNVNSNKYTYYDAEPLCKALGAELATYDQVKEAWAKGADWCNYGWVKGQQALFPTQEETYKKMELGPEDQRLSCGKPGVNGGFFDNPELRFGVSCYGAKPAQSEHDAIEQSAGIPMSPDALEYDKKVAQFKSETGSIGILPFNTKSWSA
jgi:hypothetical protein